jgi:hypothetical protein
MDKVQKPILFRILVSLLIFIYYLIHYFGCNLFILDIDYRLLQLELYTNNFGGRS